MDYIIFSFDTSSVSHLHSKNISYFHWICPIAFMHCYVWGYCVEYAIRLSDDGIINSGSVWFPHTTPTTNHIHFSMNEYE